MGSVDKLYVVLKLSTTVTLIDPFTGKDREEKIQGIAGFMPCFETLEEAEEHACDGKYIIMPIKSVIKTTNPQNTIQ